MSEENRLNRIAFCHVLLDEWDENKLNSIIFSDEKTFCTDVSWRTNVYRPHNTRYDPEFLKVKDRSGRVTNNYWGAIGYNGPVTPIVRIEGRFNSNRYMRIIRSNVIPMMNRFENDGAPRIFMQDNSPIHTSNAVMGLFSRQRPKSPDLNPIENVWSIMENGWPKIHPWNQETLDEVVVERWNALHNDARKFLL